MSYQYVTIDVDGEEVHVSAAEKPTLAEMQKIVGGNIQLVQCLYEGQRKSMIVNEDGKLQGLDVNHKATYMYGDLRGVTGDFVVGRAIVFKDFELD